MIKIGDYNTLKVEKKFKGGVFLAADGKELYLPKKDTPSGIREGDELEVFVYNKDRDSLAATTAKPLARVGEFASLKVVDIRSFGAFLDWGIDKDLFLPNRRQTRPLQIGDRVVVRLVPDFEEDGIVGDMNLDIYFDHDTSVLSENEKVDLIVYGLTDLGFKVIVNRRYAGLVYRSEGYREPSTGDELSGYISRIRDDGKLDVSLKKKGYAAVEDSREILLKAVKDSGGFLPLHDKSDPEVIKERLGMSKKLFKKCAGGLYRDGLIVIEPSGLRLTEDSGNT